MRHRNMILIHMPDLIKKSKEGKTRVKTEEKIIIRQEIISGTINRLDQKNILQQEIIVDLEGGKILHIWTIENWIKVLDYDNYPYRTGLRLVFDKNVDLELRSECKKFAKWMRSEYFFPIRVPVYFKNKEKLKCLDGDLAYGTCFLPDSYKNEPYIRIAVGDFPVIKEKWGAESALFSVFGVLAHELTHYFQWVNGLQLTQSGKERQASAYSKFITEEYSEIWDNVHLGSKT